MGNSCKKMKYSNEKIKELYDFWNSCSMLGPITFFGNDKDNIVEITFYESYEILDGPYQDMFIRKLEINIQDQSYNIKVIEENDEISEEKVLSLEDLKVFIMKKYDEIKEYIKD